MSNETIRQGLVDAINEIARLLEHCDDPNLAFELKIKKMELFHELDLVIVTTLTAGTADFNHALASLTELTAAAKAAKDDVNKIAVTINKAAEAVGRVAKLVKGVVGVLAIL